MPSTTQKSNLGLYGENLAAKFLENRGYRIISSNFLKPWGEIDIICEKEDVLIFVEVKTNKKEVIGFEPELRANSEKMRKVQRTARTYLAYKNIPFNKEWRIDIIAVILNVDRGVAKIRHYKNI